ncbi:hypothetical protein MPSEU_000843600 [Mayamaea pseudoterrestris]|nr:hypothetical protein MPSEU_000843600 [Mayamaea pseudoterrestris]
MRRVLLLIQILNVSLGLQQCALLNARSRVTNLLSATQRQQSPRSLPKAFLMMNFQDENDDDDDLDFSNFQRRQLPETAFGSEAVPEGQRPINEYLDLQRAPLFGWATLQNAGLFWRLLLVYAFVFSVICYPIAGATFTLEGYTLQKVASANVGALSLIILLLLRFFSGWGYVGERLTSKVIEYEETGWYDGDFERKTKTEEMRDRMVYNSEVKPVIERIKQFSLAASGLWVASVIGFNVAMDAKPLFNEYDPNMLEKLRYDDKLAETAASYTGGRPAYCDSRYYRAVAGGSGCK